MNYIERIQRSIDFMEAHLAEEIDLGDVAKQAYMSLASFYRLYYGFTGYSAMTPRPTWASGTVMSL